MKDKKFIILLILIIVIGIFNFLWVYHLQERVTLSLQTRYSRNVFADQITTKTLRIVDKDRNVRIRANLGTIALFPPGGTSAQMQLTCVGVNDSGLAQIRLWNNPDPAKGGGQLVISAGDLPRWPDIELSSALGYSTRITSHRVRHSPP